MSPKTDPPRDDRVVVSSPPFSLTMRPPVEVRRFLQAIRHAWDTNHPRRPMRPCLEISPGLSIAQFCLEFTVQHHNRRYRHKTTRRDKQQSK